MFFLICLNNIFSTFRLTVNFQTGLILLSQPFWFHSINRALKAKMFSGRVSKTEWHGFNYATS